MRYNAISGCTHLSKFADKSKIKIDRLYKYMNICIGL